MKGNREKDKENMVYLPNKIGTTTTTTTTTRERERERKRERKREREPGG